ncbi:MAG: neutral/alkaline non-lysosomal ceramidase N-terminal domain-containing protein [Chloroflexota bacterium]
MPPQLRVGVSRAVTTPPVGIAHPFWGAQTHTRAEGVDMELWTTALVASDGETTVAIVDSDLPWVPDALSREVRQRVSDLTQIPATHVRITATHTHSGGPVAPGWYPEGTEMIPGYVTMLTDKIVGAVWQAHRDMRPARIAAGIGHSEVALNRRMWHPGQQRIVLGRNYGGFVDHDLLVARIDDEHERPIAVLVNYACHPTIMAHGNSLITPDFPGPLRRTVEANVGGLCLFLQGCAGDRHPRETFSSKGADYRKVGTLLGLEAAKVAVGLTTLPKEERLVEVLESGAELGIYEETPGPEPDGAVRAVTSIVELPLIDLPTLAEAEADLATKAEALAEARRSGDDREIRRRGYVAKRAGMQLHNVRQFDGRATARTELQAFKIGCLTLVAMPGEPFAEVGVEIRRRSPAAVTMVSGYSNGEIGYIPMKSDYKNGGYGVWNSAMAPGAAEQLIEAAGDLLESI